MFKVWRCSGNFIVNFSPYFTPLTSPSVVDFEKVNVSWEALKLLKTSKTCSVLVTLMSTEAAVCRWSSLLVFLKISQISYETPVLESYINLKALTACNFIKKRLQHRCFHVMPNFKEQLFYRTPPVVASLSGKIKWLQLAVKTIYQYIYNTGSIFQQQL